MDIFATNRPSFIAKCKVIPGISDHETVYVETQLDITITWNNQAGIIKSATSCCSTLQNFLTIFFIWNVPLLKYYGFLISLFWMSQSYPQHTFFQNTSKPPGLILIPTNPWRVLFVQRLYVCSCTWIFDLINAIFLCSKLSVNPTILPDSKFCSLWNCSTLIHIVNHADFNCKLKCKCNQNHAVGRTWCVHDVYACNAVFDSILLSVHNGVSPDPENAVTVE